MITIFIDIIKCLKINDLMELVNIIFMEKDFINVLQT